MKRKRRLLFCSNPPWNLINICIKQFTNVPMVRWSTSNRIIKSSFSLALNQQIEEFEDLFLAANHEKSNFVLYPIGNAVQVEIEQQVSRMISPFFQDEVPLVGRIVCDSAGQLNSQSIILEGSSRTSKCNRVRLDVSSLLNYSLFPGQVKTPANFQQKSTFLILDRYGFWHLHKRRLFSCETIVRCENFRTAEFLYSLIDLATTDSTCNRDENQKWCQFYDRRRSLSISEWRSQRFWRTPATSGWRSSDSSIDFGMSSDFRGKAWQKRNFSWVRLSMNDRLLRRICKIKPTSKFSMKWLRKSKGKADYRCLIFSHLKI